MKRALIVGVDYYEHGGSLNGCVNDAHAVGAVLERHGDGSPNFGVRIETATGESSAISRKDLKAWVAELFADDADIALFYFSGHGYVDSLGGYLVTSEASDGDDGFSMDELLSIVNDSPSKNRIIVLDCCHSGAAGGTAQVGGKTLLDDGVTILAASAKEQYALESDGTGVFTGLLVDALSGSASNLVGDITPGSVYAHVDQSLGPWDQRPIFKTNVKTFISLREVQPPIPLDELRMLVELFAEAGSVFELDPSYEPTSDQADEEHTRLFAILQRMNNVNLVRPVDEEHMYFAAMNSTGCKLTVLGAHYRRLVDAKRI